jgi:hypothetical protein
MVDEPDILVQSLTITPAREKKLFKGPNKATQGIQLTDPTISFAFKGIISTAAGLADQHPGTVIAELANFADTIHGFDPGDGIILYEDPSREYGLDDPAMVSFTATQYPFVEAAPAP